MRYFLRGNAIGYWYWHIEFSCGVSRESLWINFTIYSYLRCVESIHGLLTRSECVEATYIFVNSVFIYSQPQTLRSIPKKLGKLSDTRRAL